MRKEEVGVQLDGDEGKKEKAPCQDRRRQSQSPSTSNTDFFWSPRTWEELDAPQVMNLSASVAEQPAISLPIFRNTQC